jgi:hypothetical protein
MSASNRLFAGREDMSKRLCGGVAMRFDGAESQIWHSDATIDPVDCAHRAIQSWRFRFCILLLVGRRRLALTARRFDPQASLRRITGVQS